MKRSVFNHDGVYVEYTLHRDGPPHQFVCCYRGGSWLLLDRDQVAKRFKDVVIYDELSEWLQALELKAPASDTQLGPSTGNAPGEVQGSESVQSWDPVHH